MRNLGCWGSQLELKTAATLFLKSVYVATDTLVCGECKWTVFPPFPDISLPEALNFNVNNLKPQIEVSYTGGCHYGGILPIRSDKPLSPPTLTGGTLNFKLQTVIQQSENVHLDNVSRTIMAKYTVVYAQIDSCIISAYTNTQEELEGRAIMRSRQGAAQATCHVMFIRSCECSEPRTQRADGDSTDGPGRQSAVQPCVLYDCSARITFKFSRESELGLYRYRLFSVPVETA